MIASFSDSRMVLLNPSLTLHDGAALGCIMDVLVRTTQQTIKHALLHPSDSSIDLALVLLSACCQLYKTHEVRFCPVYYILWKLR